MLPRSAPRFVAALASLALTLLIGTSAFARAGGIVAYSGKTPGKFCTACHDTPNGTAAPQVAIQGPDQLKPGESAEYQFVVTTNTPSAGADIAATDGVTLAPGAGLRLDTGEVTHMMPFVVNAGSAVFKFTVTAPNTAQAITLYAAGNAVNDSGDRIGDNAATTTKTVQVMAAVVPPADAGTAPATPGGGTSDDGGAVSPAGSDDTGGPGANVERRVPPDGGARPFTAGSDEPFDPTFAQTGLSCTVSRTDAPIEPGALALVGLALLAAGARRTTRRSREDA